MLRQNKKGKHVLSPQPDLVAAKKSRAIYITESPGGTMRETQPSAVHQFGTSTMNPTDSKPKDVPLPKAEDDEMVTCASILAAMPIRSAAASASTTLPDPRIAITQNPEDTQAPKQGKAVRNPNYDLSQEHLSTLSVREKLRKGIAMSFANNLAYGNATAGTVQSGSQRTPGPVATNSMTVAGIMTSAARQHHMAPELYYHHLKGMPERTEMVEHELTTDAPEYVESTDTRWKKIEHKKARWPEL